VIIRIFEIVFPLFAVVSAGFVYGYFHKSDIEQTLAYSIHGPIELIIIITDES